MAYNNSIPQPADRINASQNDLLQNFQSIDTVISVDHITFDAASGNQGKHNVVSMPNYVDQSAPGPTEPTAAADEIKLFTKSVSGITQLFVLPETGDTSTAERNITSATRANTGETTLPSGIMIKWGRSTTPGGGSETIVFANPFTTIFTVMATNSNPVGTTAIGEDGLIRVYTFVTTQFQVRSYSSLSIGKSIAYTWFAIGV